MSLSLLVNYFLMLSATTNDRLSPFFKKIFAEERRSSDATTAEHHLQTKATKQITDVDVSAVTACVLPLVCDGEGQASSGQREASSGNTVGAGQP